MATDMFSLAEKTVIITGGLGQLGRQFAASLLDGGASVAILDPAAGKAPLEDPLAAFESTGRLIVEPCDVTDRASLEAALEKVEATFGVPTGLVNNAALDSPPNSPASENGPFETYPEASWDQIMAVNVKGTMMACQVIGGRMAAAGGGSIVNIGSIYGVVSPNQDLYEYRRKDGEAFFKPVAYAASKSAIYNLTRYLSTYWGGQSVRVNALTFGGVFNNQDPEFLEEYHKRVPLRRMANEDEYNGAVVFLLSDASSYMTGSNMVIDGGWTAW